MMSGLNHRYNVKLKKGRNDSKIDLNGGREMTLVLTQGDYSMSLGTAA